MERCERCATMEDLLETARIQVESARREAEKADDEALQLKAEHVKVRAEAYHNDYAVIKAFQKRAETAEASLAEHLAKIGGGA